MAGQDANHGFTRLDHVGREAFHGIVNMAETEYGTSKILNGILPENSDFSRILPPFANASGD